MKIWSKNVEYCTDNSQVWKLSVLMLIASEKIDSAMTLAFGELCYDAVFGWHRTPWIKTCIIRYSPARRSANVKARSAERGSWVDSHLSGFSMLSMENDEELRSAADSIFVVCCKFLFLCCWHRIFSIAQTVISDVSDKLSSFLFLLSAVDKKMLMSYVYSECELT